MIIPTGAEDPRMTTAKRQTLADFMYYSLCAGQTKAGPYGYSPLPLNLVQAGFKQLAKLKKADPKVDLTNRDVALVQQPDLRRQEPQPQRARRHRAAARRLRQGRRGSVRHRHRHRQAEHRRRHRAHRRRHGWQRRQRRRHRGRRAPGAGRRAATAGGSAPPPRSTRETGAVTTERHDDDRGATTIYANPTELAAGRPADDKTFGWLAVARAARARAGARAVRRGDAAPPSADRAAP